MFFILPDEIVKYFDNPTKWLADELRVSEELYRKVLEYRNLDGAAQGDGFYCQCTGLTKKKKRCRNIGEEPLEEGDIRNFTEGITDRCKFHKERK